MNFKTFFINDPILNTLEVILRNDVIICFFCHARNNNKSREANKKKTEMIQKQEKLKFINMSIYLKAWIYKPAIQLFTTGAQCGNNGVYLRVLSRRKVTE